MMDSPKCPKYVKAHDIQPGEGSDKAEVDNVCCDEKKLLRMCLNPSILRAIYQRASSK